MNQQVVQSAFQLGQWQVEPSTNRIVGHGGTVTLEPKVMQLLICLHQAAGETVSRQTLEQTIWPRSFSAGETLNRAVSK